MKKYYFYSMALLLSGVMNAQTGKVGVNTDAPTETLQVKGTTRITTLPEKGTNKISTKPDGSASQRVDQPFTPTRTIVTDDNGVLGVIDGLPVTELPDVKSIKYTTKTVPIDSRTPFDSELSLGNLTVRFNGTNPTGREQSLSFKLINTITDEWGSPALGDNVIVNQIKVGFGGLFGGQDFFDTATKNQWYEITKQKPNVTNRDFVQYIFTLVNTRELYRLSVNVNNPTRGTLVGSRAQVTLFLERLTNQ